MADAEQILNKLLLQVAKEQNFVDYDLNVEPISSGGANYTSKLYNVTISEGGKDVQIFAKVAAIGDKMRSQTPKLYETESFVYTKLVKVYEQLQDQHQVPQEHRLAYPKFYGCNTTLYEETVLLENLFENGYQAYDRFKSIDWEYSKTAVREMAKMHALSFAYAEYHSEEFNKVIEDIQFDWNAKSDMSVYFKNMVKTAAENSCEDKREKLQRFFESFDKHQLAAYYKWTRRPVLGHCDFRPSNLMHRIREVR